MEKALNVPYTTEEKCEDAIAISLQMACVCVITHQISKAQNIHQQVEKLLKSLKMEGNLCKFQRVVGKNEVIRDLARGQPISQP